MMNSDETFILNGFVVQGDVVDEWLGDETIYQGVALRESWPLRWVETPEAQDLTEKVESWFEFWNDGSSSYYGLWVCPDLVLVQEYCRYCLSLGMTIRVLAYQSYQTSPKIPEKVLPDIERLLHFLGYDYAGASFYYSMLPEEIYEDGLAEQKKFQAKLNENGLFSSWEDLTEFVRVRNRLIQEGVNLENCYNGVEHAIYLCSLEELLEV